MIELLAIPLLAVLNRIRGGGFGAEHLPGHPRFFIAPLVGLVAGADKLSIMAGLVFGLSYLAWSFIPWGHCIGLGRWSPVRDPAWLESKVLTAAGGRPWLALLILEAIGLTPALVLVSPFVLLMPPLMLACYELGWRLRPKAPIELAELLVGVLWGALLVVS